LVDSDFLSTSAPVWTSHRPAYNPVVHGQELNLHSQSVDHKSDAIVYLFPLELSSTVVVVSPKLATVIVKHCNLCVVTGDVIHNTVVSRDATR